MKAMILAAGAGTRLYPLTATTPKPMVPVANEPVLAHVIRAVRRHGFTDLAINTSYLPDAITSHFGDGRDYGVTIRYSREEQALGTAGGVRRLTGFWGEDTFLVIGGDDLTDMDLGAMLDFHRSHGGLATLALCPVADPSQFGVVVTEPDGLITGFQEKPKPSEAQSDLCNMQVYLFSPRILDLIPAQGFSDFGSQLFPAWVRRGLPLYGYRAKGYWRDIGHPRDYLAANLDFLEGRTALAAELAPSLPPTMGPGAVVRGPVHLGRAVFVEPGAIVGPNCVIGDHVRVGAGAGLDNCVVWPGVEIAAGAQVTSAIVTPHCTVEVAA